MVETGSLAFGLFETRRWIWHHFTPDLQQRVGEQLLANVSRSGINGNWLLFRVLTHAFLRSVGWDISPSQTMHDLDAIESYYRGDGWYSDGGDSDATKFDYYNAWSMNMYPLLWARMEGDALDRERAARFRARSVQHVQSLVHMIGGDGGPVFQGRSLTYRAAMVSSLWAAALHERESVSGPALAGIQPGLIRRASSAVLAYFDPAVDAAAGRLSLGWSREFPAMAQRYSGPGSPYWMSKAFLGLLLPPEHPTWTEPDVPLPIESADFVRPEPVPGWVLAGERESGIVRLVNTGTTRRFAERDPHSQDLRDDPNYARFAYSSATAPVLDGRTVPVPLTVPATAPGNDPRLRLRELAPGDEASLPDNSVVVMTPDGLPAVVDSIRSTSKDAGPRRSARFSLLSAPGEAPFRVEGELISTVTAHEEVRSVRILTPFDGDVVLTGYAVAAASPVVGRCDGVSAVCDGESMLRSMLTVEHGDGVPMCSIAGATAFGNRSLLPAARFPGGGDGREMRVRIVLGTTPGSTRRRTT